MPKSARVVFTGIWAILLMCPCWHGLSRTVFFLSLCCIH